MTSQRSPSIDCITDAVAGIPLDRVAILGQGLWGPTLDLGDGTLLKLVRHRAGIGAGLDICANEARVLAALDGRRLGPLAVPRLVAHGIFGAHTAAADQGYAAWLRLTRVSGAPCGEEWLARLSTRERDRFAVNLGESIATLQRECSQALGTGLDTLGDRVYALLTALAKASPGDSELSAELAEMLDATPAGHRRSFVHGDAHLSNLLLGADGLICGVIDFAEAGRGVPEIDLVYLHWLPEIAAAARRSYEAGAGPIDDHAWNIAGAIYAVTGAVISEQHGDPAAAKSDRALLTACLRAIGL